MRRLRLRRLSNRVNLTYAALVALIACLLCIASLFAMQKESFHLDEIYTYGFANGYQHPFINAEDDLMKWHDPSFYHDYLTVQDNERFAYESVYETQSRDLHPPIYSFCIHTICSFFPDTFTQWFGIGLNLVFFAGALVILYVLAYLITNNKSLALIICAAYGLSTGAISNVVFIRMYMMLTFFTLLTTYLHGLLVIDAKNKVRILVTICITTICGFLTHYFFAVYAFIVALGFFVYLLKHKKHREIIIYAIAMITCAIVSIMLFPACLHMFSADVESTVDSAVVGGYSAKLMLFGWHLTKDLFGGPTLFLIMVLLVAVIMITKRLNPINMFFSSYLENKNKEYVLIILVAAIFTFFVNIKISPFYDSWRYVSYIYPIIVLLTILFAHILILRFNRNKVLTNVLLLAIIFLCTATSSMNGNIDYLFKGKADALGYVMSKYTKYSAFCVAENTHNMTIAIPLLMQHRKSCYVSPNSTADDISLMLAKDGQTFEPIVVYFPRWNNEGDTDETILNNIIEKGNYRSSTKLFNKKQSGLSTNIYLLE